jgi:HPt (histidine-containing phosphotransfer) domain-containing protein
MSDEKDVQDLDDQILQQMLEDFLQEALERLDQLNLNLILLEDDPGNGECIDLVFRLVHTIKGSAGFAGLNEMSRVGAKMEEILGEYRKTGGPVPQPVIDSLFEGLEVMSDLREKAAAGDMSPVDVTVVIARLENAPGDAGAGEAASESLPEAEPVRDDTGLEGEELLQVYKGGYDQLSALKHLVYSSLHLADKESLAALVSRQISDRMSPHSNEIWLVQDGKEVSEIARDGELIQPGERRTIEISSSDIISRVIEEQTVCWSSSSPELKTLLPDFSSPMIIPLKGRTKSLGFMVINPEESDEAETYQFVGQFAAMILNIAALHQEVEKQKEELDEMTAILFRQNSILSSLYHVELALMNIKNPVDLCRIVAEAFVHDLETRSAAIFLRNEGGELKGLWGSGLRDIEMVSFQTDEIEPVRQALESGRIVSQQDYPGVLEIGGNRLDHWIIMCLKGREAIHGVVIAELDVDDVTDSMSILANYSGILLDNLILENKIGS